MCWFSERVGFGNPHFWKHSWVAVLSGRACGFEYSAPPAWSADSRHLEWLWRRLSGLHPSKLRWFPRWNQRRPPAPLLLQGCHRSPWRCEIHQSRWTWLKEWQRVLELGVFPHFPHTFYGLYHVIPCYTHDKMQNARNQTGFLPWLSIDQRIPHGMKCAAVVWLVQYWLLDVEWRRCLWHLQRSSAVQGMKGIKTQVDRAGSMNRFSPPLAGSIEFWTLVSNVDLSSYLVWAECWQFTLPNPQIHMVPPHH